ncbi:MAG TPA: hypothetical protein EYP29_01525 [Thermoplasmata archaeon]|nr:hypothetical protein [Thermoplasmata archaeon]
MKDTIALKFTFFYQNSKEAEAIFSSIVVDNQDFNKRTGEELIKTELKDKKLTILVKGKNLPSLRETAEDLLRAHLAAEKCLNVFKLEGRKNETHT